MSFTTSQLIFCIDAILPEMLQILLQNVFTDPQQEIFHIRIARFYCSP